MHNNRARYIRLIDMQPTSLRSTEAGDVPCSIEIGMEFESTSLAFVDKAVPIVFVNVSTSRALLTGVPCVDVDNRFALGFGFVVDEPLELAERPVPEHLIELSSESFISSNSELFQCYCVEWLGDYPICDLMIDIGHETFFSPGKFLEFSFGGSSAFGLEFTTQMLIFSLDLSNMIGTVELIIGKDRVVDNASIYSNDCIWWSDGWVSLLDNNPENEFITIVGEFSRDDLPILVFYKIWGDHDRDLHSTLNTCKGDETLPNPGCECSLIVSDGRPSLLDRKDFTFFSFEHLGSIIPGCRDNGGWDVGIFLSDGIVGEMMEFEFIDNLVLEPDLKNIISSEVDHFYGSNQSFIGFEMQGNGSLHKTSLDSEIYIFDVPIPPMAEPVGFLGGYS